MTQSVPAPSKPMPSGRCLAPRPFAALVLAVYVAGFASQLLVSQPALAYGGLWLFAATQALLLSVWYALHVRRLRDAGRPAGAAAGIAAICGLAALLLLLILGFLQETFLIEETTRSGPLMSWFAMAFVLAGLFGAIDIGAGGLVLILLALIALTPWALAVGFSLWTATRPRATAP